MLKMAIPKKNRDVVKTTNTEESLFYNFFKLLIMSVLELKGEVYEILVEVRTEQTILKIRDFILQAVREENSAEDLEKLLSEEQIIRLRKTIANSRTSSNLIDHEDVKKKYAQWFNR
jgi:hypothetical protein